MKKWDIFVIVILEWEKGRVCQLRVGQKKKDIFVITPLKHSKIAKNEKDGPPSYSDVTIVLTFQESLTRSIRFFLRL